MKPHDQIVQGMQNLTPGFLRRLKRGLQSLGLAVFGYGLQRPELPRNLRKVLQHVTREHWVYVSSVDLYLERSFTLKSPDTGSVLIFNCTMRDKTPLTIILMSDRRETSIEIPIP